MPGLMHPTRYDDGKDCGDGILGWQEWKITIRPPLVNGKAISLSFPEHGGDVDIARRPTEHLEPVAEAIEDPALESCATPVDIRPALVDVMVKTNGAVGYLLQPTPW